MSKLAAPRFRVTLLSVVQIATLFFLIANQAIAQTATNADARPQVGGEVVSKFSSEKGLTNAPITIIEFSDMECPFCGRASSAVQQLMRAYPDKIRLIFKHAPLPFHTKAKQAHEALLAAGTQGKFWEMHDLIFADQSKLEASDLIGYAKQLKLNVEDFTHALNSHTYAHVVERDLAEARALGVEAVPTFFVNGRKMEGAQPLAAFKSIVDEDLGLKMPKAETANGTAAPVRQINIKGAPSKGDEKSPVTMVVFTDFQCPFCSRVVPTLEQVQRGYVDKVKLVFKNFPLDFHPDAQLAHEAAMAAADQGKFWEMHEVIFANQRSLERADLLRFAEQVGLDMKRFVADLDGRKFRAAIEADKLEAAELGVTGTPAIFVNGKMLSGARPLADFRALVDAEIPGAVWTEPTTITAAKLSAEKREDFDERTVKGAKNAPITLLWFSDMQSSLSPRAAQLIQQVMDANPGKVRVIFKHRPLEQLRPNAIEVHEAALAVGAQGKFWEMHDLLLANQKSLTREDLIKLAARLGVPRAEITRALEAGTYRPQIEKDLAEARRREVRGSPVFFVNNTRIDGLQPLKVFQEVIDAKLIQTAKETQALNSARE